MERKEAIEFVAQELDKIRKSVEEDPELDDEQRAALLASADNLEKELRSGEGEDVDANLKALLSLFGRSGALDDDEESDTLSLLANESSDLDEPKVIACDEIWRSIRCTLADDMHLKHILYSDGEDDYYTAQFGMGDGEGRQLIVRVIYTPDVDCIQFRAGYPFTVDQNILPIARTYICKRNYEMRYTRIELDERDGEVYVCLVMRMEDPHKLPPNFQLMLNLAISVGFDDYDTLRRYSRAEFTDEERADFLAEVERISSLMLE